MKRKLQLACTLLTLITVIALQCTLAYAEISEDLPTVDELRVVFLVFVAALIYIVSGMLNAVVKGQDFDGQKVTHSILVTLIVIVIALVTGLDPEIVVQTHGDTISTIIGQLIETGVFIPLIYFFTKLFGILKGVYDQYKLRLGAKPPPSPS